VVEELGVKGRCSFTNYDELQEIVNSEGQNKITRSIKQNGRTRIRI